MIKWATQIPKRKGAFTMKAGKRRSPARTLVTALLVLSLVGSAAAAGWLWYDNNVDRSGWVELEGGTGYKDFHGKPVSGWQEIDGKRCYFREDHTLAVGELVIDGSRYWFGEDGRMATHWQTRGEDTFYYGSDGRLRIGWQEIDGSRHYFAENGAMAQGWLSLDGSRYYLEKGSPVSGWQNIKGNRHYFAETGELQTGWQEIDGSTYFLNTEGIPLTGPATLDGANYYFGEDGIRFTGWQDTEEGRKLYLSDGTQAFGWAELEGKRYYFDDSGIMVTGWLQLGEYSYYLQEDGSAAVGPTKIGYYTHYFTPVGIHVVLVNAANPLPPYYDMELVTVTGWHQVSSVCLEPLVNMLADCNAAGISYNFNSAHRTVKEQTMILDLRTEEYMDTGMTYEAARAKALQTVAYPGTSEHHLGLAVDLLGDAAIEWLTEHCWEYGFIVRYTQDKYPITGIIDEPWHFRYVGTEVSLAMKDSGLCLEEYLGAA